MGLSDVRPSSTISNNARASKHRLYACNTFPWPQGITKTHFCYVHLIFSFYLSLPPILAHLPHGQRDDQIPDLQRNNSFCDSGDRDRGSGFPLSRLIPSIFRLAFVISPWKLTFRLSFYTNHTSSSTLFFKNQPLRRHADLRMLLIYLITDFHRYPPHRTSKLNRTFNMSSHPSPHNLQGHPPIALKTYVPMPTKEK